MKYFPLRNIGWAVLTAILVVTVFALVVGRSITVPVIALTVWNLGALIFWVFPKARELQGQPLLAFLILYFAAGVSVLMIFQSPELSLGITLVGMKELNLFIPVGLVTIANVVVVKA